MLNFPVTFSLSQLGKNIMKTGKKYRRFGFENGAKILLRDCGRKYPELTSIKKRDKNEMAELLSLKVGPFVLIF